MVPLHPDALEGVVQIVELHRLADVIVEAGLQRALPVFAPRVRRYAMARTCPPSPAARLANRAEQRIAVLPRHRNVGQDDIRAVFGVDPQRLGRALRFADARAGIGEHRTQQFARIGLVVDDQHVRAFEIERARARPPLDCDCRRHAMLGLANGQVHRERRSLSLAAAVGRHASAMQLDEMTPDRQTESEAAVLPRRAAVGLPEPFEDVRQKCRSDAVAGVGHIDADVGAFEPACGLRRARRAT